MTIVQCCPRIESLSLLAGYHFTPHDPSAMTMILGILSSFLLHLTSLQILEDDRAVCPFYQLFPSTIAAADSLLLSFPHLERLDCACCSLTLPSSLPSSSSRIDDKGIYLATSPAIVPPPDSASRRTCYPRLKVLTIPLECMTTASYYCPSLQSLTLVRYKYFTRDMVARLLIADHHQPVADIDEDELAEDHSHAASDHIGGGQLVRSMSAIGDLVGSQVFKDSLNSNILTLVKNCPAIQQLCIQGIYQFAYPIEDILDILLDPLYDDHDPVCRARLAARMEEEKQRTCLQPFIATWGPQLTRLIIDDNFCDFTSQRDLMALTQSLSQLRTFKLLSSSSSSTHAITAVSEEAADATEEEEDWEDEEEEDESLQVACCELPQLVLFLNSLLERWADRLLVFEWHYFQTFDPHYAAADDDDGIACCQLQHLEQLVHCRRLVLLVSAKTAAGYHKTNKAKVAKRQQQQLEQQVADLYGAIAQLPCLQELYLPYYYHPAPTIVSLPDDDEPIASQPQFTAQLALADLLQSRVGQLSILQIQALGGGDLNKDSSSLIPRQIVELIYQQGLQLSKLQLPHWQGYDRQLVIDLCTNPRLRQLRCLVITEYPYFTCADEVWQVHDILCNKLRGGGEGRVGKKSKQAAYHCLPRYVPAKKPSQVTVSPKINLPPHHHQLQLQHHGLNLADNHL